PYAATAIDRSGRVAPNPGSPAATTEDRAIWTCLLTKSCCASLERRSRVAPTPPCSGRWSQNAFDSTRRPGNPPIGRTASAAQTEPLDQGAVALHIDLRDVLEQTAPTSNQQQQPAPRVVVVLVHLEVLGQVSDALGQQRDLGLRGAGVG